MGRRTRTAGASRPSGGHRRPRLSRAGQSCAVGQLGGQEAADAVRRTERHPVPCRVPRRGRGTPVHAVPVLPARLPDGPADGHPRHRRVPRAAREHHLLRRAAQACARHRCDHLPSVRLVAVLQGRPHPRTHGTRCEPAALAWVQDPDHGNLERLRAAVHAQVSACRRRSGADAVPYRGLGPSEQ